MNEQNANKPLSIGDVVPNFEMDSYDPRSGLFGKVALSDMRTRGKWVILVFYPADFSFVCPTELADLAGAHARLEELGCELISVSTDTKYSHLAWRNSERLLETVNYEMAADPTGQVSRLFGVYDESSGAALRGTFVINPEGRLVSSQVLFYNVGRDATDLVRKMEANVHLMAHPNEACPARWKPGQTTLLPSEQMVGNVYEALHSAR